ncbi:MAG: pyruvate, phosphate dikinase [Chlamydiota bacterium]|nr:pyruvate, phosphate dikinase [Chlamydiota bacterium]
MVSTAENKLKENLSELVYPFGAQVASPPLNRSILGGKGIGLAEMASIGLPVPPGFIITTTACNEFRRSGKQLTPKIKQSIVDSIRILEKQMNSTFGSEENPVLVSVRSGAKVSMPGMMDTVLNLGMNDRSVEGFAKRYENERLAYDNYRRFIMMYSEIVEGVDRKKFEHTFATLKMQEGADLDIDLSISALKEACMLFKKIYSQECSKPFPQDVYEQLFSAIKAVFNSWDSERCALYRQIHGIPEKWGTAVTVQTMVFGNKNSRSATGVGFTRDPATGENKFYGEFLLKAQGEEVVAGIRTPHPINQYQKDMTESSLISLEEVMPEVYQELKKTVSRLEKHYKDMQDIEFTIDDGKLYMLQTRTGKRTGFAAVRMAAEMLEEGLIDEYTAIRRVAPNQLQQLLAPIFDNKAKEKAKEHLVAKGLNAGPGAASGKVAFTSSKAAEMNQQGIACILVREESCPDDFPGLVAAEGILTLRGGSTSHAAVVARGMGKPCVVGCDALHINETAKTLSVNGMSVKEGDPISIDGMTGEVYFCGLETSPSEIVQVLVTDEKTPEESLIYRHFKTIMDLADKYRSLKVRTNADNANDSRIARAFGAEGIGLCRTEHMFMDTERLNDVRRMFFSTHAEERSRGIEKLLPHQKADFIGIFRAMDGLPVNIRLLDPPLHEFMPHNADELSSLAALMGVSEEKLTKIRASLEEVNPMLGHRGCRLGIVYPEVTAMQTRAILEAAIEVTKEGKTVIPEIMVPLVGIDKELEHQRAVIEQTAEAVFKENKLSIPFKIGTMIELPRSALTADQIAKYADFFSFGTNDLTQTTYGISRDDSAKFVPTYVQGVENPLNREETTQIFKNDPFQVLDRDGVGQLMKMALEKGKSTNKHLHCGICGEHGGEPSSVMFCHEIGLDYVSCSPYRVPIARLAAALGDTEQ